MSQTGQKERERTPQTATGQPADEELFAVLESTLEYARTRDYREWDYGDGMSSRFLQAVPVDNKWLNIAVQETVKRSPVNIRPLFLVEQRRNFQGAALFAMTNLRAAQLRDQGFDSRFPCVDYRQEAADLLNWLRRVQLSGYGGFCGGHRHPIQHLDGQGQPSDPDVVSTSYGVKALLRGRDIDATHAEVARTARDFVVDTLEYEELDAGARIRYHLNHPDTYFTINAGALGARIFIDLYHVFGDAEYRRRATALLDYIATLQTDLGGWYYREPPEASHLSMDNHHNGFVIEVYQRYAEVIDDERYAATLAQARQFYRRDLFERDGAPNFDEDNRYPRDIHASTQGALVFTYAGDREFARRILGWVQDNLRADEGQFYYKKGRFLTHRVTLMRWCQAWMGYALAEFLAHR